MVTKYISHSNGEIQEWCWASDHEIFTSPFWTSCYYIDGILIDTGAPGGVEEFEEFLKSIGINNIEACYLTHTHEDHSGGAYLVKEKYNIPVYASSEGIPVLKNGFTYPLYRKIAWGEKVLPIKAEQIPKTIYTKTREFMFESFPMPGHAPDQVAFIENQKQWVFVADGIQLKYKRLFGKSSNISEDISVIYHSIKELFNFISHMDHLQLFSSGKEVIYGKDFILDRLTEIESLYQTVSGLYALGKSVDEIESIMFGEDDFLEMHTNGELSRKNLIESLINWKLNL
ncbi:MBL fold metallo-hydrolase [Candidatus Hodarchaeum mangrovi]